jgi:ferrous iron transport protein B
VKPLIVALVGNPNCGKTTLFNGLTGKQQAVGNWCGVTVEKKKGFFSKENIRVEVIDLPGCYQYTADLESALDERITYEYLASGEADLIVNVVDATHLERHLYLTLQLLEHNTPVIIALNMMDAAHKQNINIDVAALTKRMGCPVVPLTAIKKQGIEELKQKIYQQRMAHKVTSPVLNPRLFLDAATDISYEPEIAVARARYAFIHDVVNATVFRNQKPVKPSWTEKVDKIVLNRFFGIPLFLMLMYFVFVFTIRVGGIFQAYLDVVSWLICIETPQKWLTAWQVPHWIINVVAFGIGQGIHIVLSFVPVIAGMFLSLSFLEASGYMARVAFVMDKIMQWAGLPGKSFVPMIIGFGCNVPAVMASRTLVNYRERILTILMSPFMSCGARLAIYALFISAFFKGTGHNIIFALYLIGILVALITGFMLRTTILTGDRSALIIEFPPYRWPSVSNLWKATWRRLKYFVLKAGALILPLCIVFGTLTAVSGGGVNSWMVTIGRTLTPLFAPMGIEKDNWPATIGLLTGILAKEVVVGTLETLYAEEERAQKNVKLEDATFSNPEVIGLMVKRFGSTSAAFAYLLFVLLYFPCISVVATMARELNRYWAIFSVIWTTSLAYIVAVLFYQSFKLFTEGAGSSIAWIGGMFGVLFAGFCIARKVALYRDNSDLKLLPTRILILDP